MLLLSDTETVRVSGVQPDAVTTPSLQTTSGDEEPTPQKNDPVGSKSSCRSKSDVSESERVHQLSGGGEDGGEDVSSLRRRRRLSSAALGSPSSSSPAAAPSPNSSLCSVCEAVEVESAG